MKKNHGPSVLLSVALLLVFLNTGCSTEKNHKVVDIPNDSLPPPNATPSKRNFSKVLGWKDGKTPIAPEGFTVSLFADSLEHPRWIYVADNGDIFVSESSTIIKGFKKFLANFSSRVRSQHYGKSANRITLFRDADKNGVYEKRYVFAEDLNQPFGMLILGNHFYIANTNELLRYTYQPDMTSLIVKGEKILSFPTGKYNQHWTRNIITNKNKDKIYIGIGSSSNVAEHGLEEEIRRADILEINPDGSGEKVYASGLRNPVGMDWAPGTSTLWTTVNERDELGDNLVPDYLTSVKEGGFYGWPYSYFGEHVDPRMSKDPHPEMVSKAIVPDVPLGPHTASLGLTFYTRNAFPDKYRNGAFIGQHGSWNRSRLSGYKVVFVPFENGKPSGPPEDFLTGFVADYTNSEVYGRPVCVAVLADGSLLVSDDVNNKIWRVKANR